MGDELPQESGLWGRIVDLAEQQPTAFAAIDQRGVPLDRAALVAAVEAATPILRDAVGSLARIGIFLPNRTSWLVIQLAADRLGLGVVGLNTRFRAAELGHLTVEAGLGLVVAADGFLGLDTSALFGGLDPAPAVLDETALLGKTAVGGGPAASTSDRECIGFTTSGTTGFPKVAMHDLVGSLQHLDAAAAASGYGPDTCALVALPLCGTFGWVSAFAPLLAGGGIVLHETWDPVAAAAAVTEHGVTTFNGADTMQAALLDAIAAAGASSSTTLTEGVFADFANAGAEVAARATTETGGRYRLSGVYGSSEGFALMSRWVEDDPADLRRRNGGRLVSPAMGVRAVDPEDGRVLPHGEPGELQFRGPNLLARYAGNPEATTAAFDGEWFRSGDLGRTLDDHSFEYRARLGDSLRLRGFLCDPSEIEHHLEAHPGVELAQVVGAERPGEGDVAVAFVRVFDADTTPDVLRAWCRDGLANYKCPAVIEIVEEFPVTEGANGVKIRKVDLRSMAETLLED